MIFKNYHLVSEFSANDSLKAENLEIALLGLAVKLVVWAGASDSGQFEPQYLQL